MSTRYLDLAVVLLVAVAEIGLSFVPSVAGPIRVVIGLPAVVFAPGYALTAAVWPDGGLQKIERFALSVGLSLSLATLAGLLLYVTGLGLWPVPWAVALGLPTLVGSVVALNRRAHVTPSRTNGVARITARRMGWPGFVLSGGAVAVAIAAFTIAVSSASQQREQFSQLWLLPTSNASAGSVEVGLRSQELEPTTFHLQVLDGQNVALDTPGIRLAPGQTWTATIQLDPADVGQSTSPAIQALVFRSDAPDTPYRRTELQPPAPSAP